MWAQCMCILLVLGLTASINFFFFNDTATTEIYTLSLHDALPISGFRRQRVRESRQWPRSSVTAPTDRKSTRLNSSHSQISYAVFCLKKKKDGNKDDIDLYAPRCMQAAGVMAMSYRFEV